VSPDVALRRLREEDRWRLFEWRGADHIRAVSLDDRPLQRDSHAGWFDDTVENRPDEVLVVEWRERPVGVVQLESFEPDQGLSSWGCYLGETDVPPGLGAALPLLGLGYGFETHSLRRMHAQVLGHNARMRGIHRRIGIVEEGVLRRHLVRPDGTEVAEACRGVVAD
jgi:RimJ/RimL family protein N-acetyltransferase